MFRRQRADDDHEPVPEYRPPIDDGTGDAAAAPGRILDLAADPDPDRATPPRSPRAQRPEPGVDE